MMSMIRYKARAVFVLLLAGTAGVLMHAGIWLVAVVFCAAAAYEQDRLTKDVLKVEEL